MHVCAGVLATILALSGLPTIAFARAATSGCVTTPAKIVDAPQPELPTDAKTNSKTIGLEADIGSDGRVRALQLVQSSGDPATDLTFRQALQTATYEPPQTGCVAYSGGLNINYNLPDPATPSAATAPQTPGIVKSTTATCTPYATAFLTPLTRDRTHTGTAVVAVELDAAGTQIGNPVLRKKTGFAVLDHEALRLARTGQYGFLPGGTCAPQAFTYLLELTFQ